MKKENKCVSCNRIAPKYWLFENKPYCASCYNRIMFPGFVFETHGGKHD